MIVPELASVYLCTRTIRQLLSSSSVVTLSLDWLGSWGRSVILNVVAVLVCCLYHCLLSDLLVTEMTWLETVSHLLSFSMQIIITMLWTHSQILHYHHSKSLNLQWWTKSVWGYHIPGRQQVCNWPTPSMGKVVVKIKNMVFYCNPILHFTDTE